MLQWHGGGAVRLAAQVGLACGTVAAVVDHGAHTPSHGGGNGSDPGGGTSSPALPPPALQMLPPPPPPAANPSCPISRPSLGDRVGAVV